jgi:hypothetical protein
MAAVLTRVERAGLLEDLVRDGELPDVVEQTPDRERAGEKERVESAEPEDAETEADREHDERGCACRLRDPGDELGNVMPTVPSTAIAAKSSP